MRGVLTALVGVLLMATAVSAQPRASASLHPVEGGRWDVSPGSPLTFGSGRTERICLHASAYVLAGRVEPGYRGSWSLNLEGSGTGERSVTGNSIGENDGSRWSWSSFAAADGQCFDMWAVVLGGPQEGRQSSRQTTTQQLLELQQKLEPEQNVRARLDLQREISRLQLELQLQPAVLRLRLYELRVAVDW